MDFVTSRINLRNKMGFKVELHGTVFQIIIQPSTQLYYVSKPPRMKKINVSYRVEDNFNKILEIL